MKALVYTGSKTMEFKTVDDPAPAAGEALIRVRASGICGSDMHAWAGHDERRPAPLVLGHEAAGEIVGFGGAVRRVTVNPLVTCGKCEACIAGRDNLCSSRQIISMPPREGAFAELLAMPEGNLVNVPDSVALESAALCEPLACGWHAVRLARTALGGDLAQVRCLVLGGGAIGLGAALAFRAQGGRQVTIVEPNSSRRNRIIETEDIKCLKQADEHEMPDLVIDAVGIAATRASASKLVQPGGLIMHIGLGAAEGGLDIRRMTLQEVTFIGTYTYTMNDFEATAEAIFTGKLGKLSWIEKRPLKSGAQAFDDISTGQCAAPKIILQPA
ncbi:alcohol dehydrogenase catalytic domain-containing protein [Anderseniella sp. Alg231-50]|uniref:alcohol dehydrogenase catalytic domain-containing protein n=1 Tax=Anderseniella sp. Alg231-50 TaxID=1922226 RepID=UPI000D55DD04